MGITIKDLRVAQSLPFQPEKHEQVPEPPQVP